MTAPDRRRAPRRVPHRSDAVSKLRLRTGRELQVVNIGPAGVLVEAAARLLPGTCVDVHVITIDGRELVRSRVVRAWVSHVSATAIVYRGALAFDRFVAVAMAPPDAVVADDSLAVHSWLRSHRRRNGSVGARATRSDGRSRRHGATAAA